MPFWRTGQKTSKHSKKPTNVQCCSGFKEAFTDYSLNSSLHGLKYLGQRTFHTAEKWFWLVSFIISVSVALYLIIQLYKDYTHRPIITVLEPNPSEIKEIPFPAVTFCNQNAVSKKTFRNFIRRLFQKPPDKALDEEGLRILARISDMMDFCRTISIPKEIPEVLAVWPMLNQYFDKNKERVNSFYNTVQTLAETSQKCDDFIRECYWDSFHFDNCSNFFSGIITDLGYCCTFNSIPLASHLKNSRIEPKNGNHSEPELWKALEIAESLGFEELLSPIKPKGKTRNRPFKQTLRGTFYGLEVLIDNAMHDNFCETSFNSNNSMIMVSTQLDYPTNDRQYRYLASSRRLELGIRPEITLSDQSIKDFGIDKRKCYFKNEHNLIWHKHYTQSNCIEECYMNTVIQKCSCVPNYILYDVPNLPVCNWTFHSCVHKYGKYGYELDASERVQCKECLPTCTDIQYNLEVQSIPLIKKPISRIWHRKSGAELSVVNIFIDVSSVYVKLRKESVSLTQLLSNAGGLLGLFMGFSVLSLLELLYYGTLRVFCKRRQKLTAQIVQVPDIKIVRSAVS